ncbi:MAG: OmpA family protein [Muribaculaceae bacterium]|nr:OmpA family protein [Muribaculaceae bacterium]
MKIKYVLLGIAMAAVPVSASANFLKDLGKALEKGAKWVDNTAKTVKKYDDDSRAKGGRGILSERDRARLDAFTSSGVGGKALAVGAVATSVYGQAAKKDVSNATDILDNATTNYNSNNAVIEDKGWNGTPNNSSAINAFVSLGSAAHAKAKEKDIEKANEAFFEMNKMYMDPKSSMYDPYFTETLKYDKNGRITGRMDSYDRINTIKEINKGKGASSDWDSMMQRLADKYAPSGTDKNTYIEENRRQLEEEAMAEIARERKENMQKFKEGKYDVPQVSSEPEPKPEPKPTPVEVLPAPVVISGYALNAVEMDAAMLEQLEEVFNILSLHPNYQITVFGNTCDLGNDTINDLKGMQRAENAKGYLVNKGISESRITVDSNGATKPAVENSSIENRKLNRRIEVVFNK